MSEVTPETPTPPPAGAPEPPAPQAAPEAPAPQAAAPAQPETPAPAATSTDELPPWAQRELKKLRDEAAGNRVKAKEVADSLAQFKAEQEQQRQAFAKALGLAPDEPPTAEQLTKQLADAQAERTAAADRARQAAVELAVFRAAAAQQVDGNALLDSRAFVSALEGLDPTAADFQQQVTAAIVTAAQQNPRYQITPPAPPAPEPPAPPAIPKSGAEFGAPPQGPRQWTDEDLIGKTPKQVQDAINAGLLENMGFGPKRASRR
jgi:hypothetical protein